MSILSGLDELKEKVKRKLKEGQIERKAKTLDDQVEEGELEEESVLDSNSEQDDLTPQSNVSLSFGKDTSGSMAGKSMVDDNKTKLQQASEAELDFLRKLDFQQVSVGIVAFGGGARNLVGLTSDADRLENEIDNTTAHGGTPLFAAMKMAYEEHLRSRSNPRAFILTTDGRANGDGNDGEILNYAAEMKEQGIKIVCVGMGSDVREQFLKELASRDLYYHTQAPSGLGEVLDRVGGRLAIIPDESCV